MSGRNFSLTQHLSGFVNQEVASGRHQNASEVVREALRRYEDDITAEQASLAVLENVAAAGSAAIERGSFTLVNGPDSARALLHKLSKPTSRQARAGARKHG